MLFLMSPKLLKAIVSENLLFYSFLISHLISSLTQQEQMKAKQGANMGISSVSPNSGDSKEVDILRMLTKAKDEYTKVRGLFYVFHVERYFLF